MSISTLLSTIGILALLFLIAHGRAEYWKGKFESMDRERGDGEGWRSEALFLRRLVNKEVAEDAEAAENHY